MSSIIYPSSFAGGTTMTLHNGTTFRVTAYQETSSEAQLDYIILPGYVYYDPNGTVAAPTLPGIITSEIWITQTTKANLLATFVAWVANTGVRGTLTGTTLTATTKTCTARLKRVRNINPFQNINLDLKVEVVFEPLTDWV